MTRIGIASFAHMHAESYAACVNEHRDASLAGIWDADEKRGADAAKRHKTEYITDYDALLKSELDAVVICSENIHHRSQVEAAAQAGLWILCEKPLATTVEDAEAMVRACRKAKVGLGTAFPSRYAEPIIHAREVIRGGAIGKLLSATCTNNGKFPGGWFADPALSGGGAVMDHTVHVADVLRWITGAEFRKVYCACANRFNPEVEVDDVGSLQLEMDNGAIVSHVASWNRPKSFPTWGDVIIEFVGTKGSLRVNAFNEKLDLYPEAEEPPRRIGYGADLNSGLIADFIDAVRERREPSVTGEDGLRAVEVTVAAYKSANQGRFVRV